MAEVRSLRVNAMNGRPAERKRKLCAVNLCRRRRRRALCLCLFASSVDRLKANDLSTLRRLLCWFFVCMVCLFVFLRWGGGRYSSYDCLDLIIPQRIDSLGVAVPGVAMMIFFAHRFRFRFPFFATPMQMCAKHVCACSVR